MDAAEIKVGGRYLCDDGVIRLVRDLAGLGRYRRAFVHPRFHDFASVYLKTFARAVRAEVSTTSVEA